MTVCLIQTVGALDPHRAMSQYLRERWGTERGFPGGPVYAIAQTPDGYLWVGTEKGLVRFDGLNFRLYQHADPPALPDGPVLGLATDAAGDLWIRMRSPNLFRYRDGKFHDVQAELARPDPGITAMCRGQNGEVLLSALANGTLRYSGGKFVALASMADLPNFLVIAMAELPGGDLWMGTRDTGLYRLQGRAPSAQVERFTRGLPDPKVNCLLADGRQGLWVGTDVGLVRWDGAELTRSGVPAALHHVQALAMIQDRDANLWVGTASGGVLRFNSGVAAALEESGGSPRKAVNALFEDREGNLWVGDAQGIERLRDGVFTTYSTSEGLRSESGGPVWTDSQGQVWFAPSEGGLYRLQGTRAKPVTAAGLDKDVVYSIAGGNGELWVGRQRGGLTQLRFQGDTLAARTYTQADGLAQYSVYAVHQTRDGSVWAGTLSGGVSRLKDGRFTNYTSADGLASNTISAIAESTDGTVWFATPGGVSVLADGRWRSYTAQDGLPSANANCLLSDSAGVLWIGTDEGLALLDSGRVQIPVTMPAPLRKPIMGLAEDKTGWLWITTSNHVLRVNRDSLRRGTVADGSVREFGLADGLRSTEGVKRYRTVVTDAAGRIWLSLNRGLSVVDPTRAAMPAPSAPVDIQAISADGRPVAAQEPIRIPSLRQRLTFSVAGLSLSVPERVRFRYRLDGFDHGWNEPVSRGEATYTNLGPGAYRFRVVASNSDGLWNGAETAIPFEIEPAFWQTWWFRLAALLALAGVIVALYQLRLRRLTRQMNLRFEERLAERTRIAQDLHDTLLQGCISASMQLHIAVDQLPADSTARPLLSRVVQLMGQVIDEGRNAVRGLRSAASDSADLEQAFCRIRQELGVQQPADFRVIVEGRARPLHPILRDEIYRIGREALVNAFRHARATSIEVELDYAPDHLRILVRDDGCGIDPQVLRSGRDGHWGLAGMRERAESIGARLTVRSRAAAGTEVELSVPGQIAFQVPGSTRPPKTTLT